jgi:hypothetical protein
MPFVLQDYPSRPRLLSPRLQSRFQKSSQTRRSLCSPSRTWRPTHLPDYFPHPSCPANCGYRRYRWFKCLKDVYEHVSTSTRSRNEHFQKEHPRKHSNGEAISYTTIPVQSLYGFKGDRVVLKVLPNQPNAIDFRCLRKIYATSRCS